MEIVLVEWLDAQEETGALLPDAVKEQELYPVLTVGFIQKETKSEITISAAKFGNERIPVHYRDNWTIPKGMIKKIRKLGKV